jgi:iduronate 2-sulfatase
MIFSGYGAKAKGLKSRALTEFVDIYPTLCEMAGLSIPQHLQGTSLTPLLSDPNRAWNKETKSREELLARELFDHQTDPGENQNLANNTVQKSTIEDLSRQLNQGWRYAKPKK